MCVCACMRADAIKELFRYKKISAKIVSRAFFASLSLFGILVDARREISSTIKSELRKKSPDSIVKRVAVSSKNFDARRRLSLFARAARFSNVVERVTLLVAFEEEDDGAGEMPESQRITSRTASSAGVRFDQGSQIYVL